MRRTFVVITATFLVVAAIGCATTVVKKDPGPHTHGVRFYRPKPYVLLQPSPDQKVLSQSTSGSTTTRVVAQSAGQLRMSIEWLPDFTEEYAIQARTGVGKNNTTVTLTDGWRLDKVEVKLDSQATEVLKAVAGLLGTEPKLIKGLGQLAGGPGATPPTHDTKDPGIPVYGHEVPLGYYESVIGCGPDGKKRLHGWRYVGFAPFANCPIDMMGTTHQTCETADLYGLVAVKNKLVFRRLAELGEEMKPITLISDQREAPPPKQE